MPPPISSEFTDRLKKLEDEVSKAQRARQPYFGEWIEFSNIFFEYSSASQLTVNEIDPQALFRVGDRVRIKEAGDSEYRYFYIASPGTNYLNLAAGDDYSLADLDIEHFSVSRVDALGFPLAFDYTPTVGKYYVSDGTPSVNFVEAKFRMDRNRVIVFDGSTGMTVASPYSQGFTLTHPIDQTLSEATTVLPGGAHVPLFQIVATTYIQYICEAPFGSFDKAYIRDVYTGSPVSSHAVVFAYEYLLQ